MIIKILTFKIFLIYGAELVTVRITGERLSKAFNLPLFRSTPVCGALVCFPMCYAVTVSDAKQNSGLQ